jgi:hypothetical protein
MRKFAEKLASNDWILTLDSDEEISDSLAYELNTLNLNGGVVYSIPRHNFFNNKWIKWCGWYPDRQFRIYNRTQTTYSNDLVHESIQIDNMRTIPLSSPIFHYSYETMEDFINKMQKYSSLFAKQNAGKKNSSLAKAIVHGAYRFFKSYIFQRGLLGGREGYIISAYNGQTAYYKYLKLAEANQQLQNSD